MRLAIVTCLMLCGLLLASLADAAPRVRGKTVSEWIDLLQSGSGPDERAARAALIGAGAKGVAAVGKRIRVAFWIEPYIDVLFCMGEPGLDELIAAAGDRETIQRAELIRLLIAPD